MEIGNLSVSHVDLVGLSSASLTAEIDGASTMLAADVGTVPSTFAYPLGDWSGSVIAAVAKAGFSLAVTTVSGCTESYGYRLEVPRLRVGPGMSPADLLAMVTPCDG